MGKGGKVPQRALTCRPGRRGGHSKDLAVHPTEGPEMAHVHLRVPNPERIQAVREEQDVQPMSRPCPRVQEVVFYSFVFPAAPGGNWGACRCGAEPMGANMAAVRERGVLVPRGVERMAR